MPFAHIQWKKEEFEKLLPLLQELQASIPPLPNISPTQRALMDHFDTTERIRLESLLQTALMNPDLLPNSFEKDQAKSDIETYLRLSQLRQQIEHCRDQIETLLTGKLSHNKMYAEAISQQIQQRMQKK
jgi:hypothetical protein